MEAVRTAGPGDWARCAQLLARARDEERRRRGGRERELFGSGSGDQHDSGDGTAEALAAWAGRDDHTVLVGLYHGVPVGVGAARALAPAGRRRLGRVECCYVEPGARQVGVGTAIIAGLVEWLGASGCTDVEAPALPGDRDTKQLLEAAGFKARLLLLHRPIG